MAFASLVPSAGDVAVVVGAVVAIGGTWALIKHASHGVLLSNLMIEKAGRDSERAEQSRPVSGGSGGGRGFGVDEYVGKGSHGEAGDHWDNDGFIELGFQEAEIAKQQYELEQAFAAWEQSEDAEALRASASSVESFTEEQHCDFQEVFGHSASVETADSGSNPFGVDEKPWWFDESIHGDYTPDQLQEMADAYWAMGMDGPADVPEPRPFVGPQPPDDLGYRQRKEIWDSWSPEERERQRRTTLDS